MVLCTIYIYKIKNLPEGDKKKALEEKVKKHKVGHDAYLAKVTSSCVVSDRVYINSIADGNVKSGKLGVGYGGGKNKLGPEYGFGLSIAEKIKGPIYSLKLHGVVNPSIMIFVHLQWVSTNSTKNKRLTQKQTKSEKMRVLIIV